MAQATLTTLLTRIGNLIELDSSTISDDLTLYINMAGRRIWNAHPWPERVVDAIVSTVAPYETGTVALTNGATTCVGTGTTFPSASPTVRKIALSMGSPWYRTTYVSGTSLTLARNYLEDTETAASFVLYQDEYDVAAAAKNIQGVYLILDRTRGKTTPLPQAFLDAAAFTPDQTGAPSSWSPCTETTAGTPRIRLHPVPDDTYGLVVRYEKVWTDLTSGGDTPALHQDREELLIYGACLWAQRLAQAKNIVSSDTFDKMMAEAWSVAQRRRPGSFQRLPFDHATYGGDSAMDLSALIG